MVKHDEAAKRKALAIADTVTVREAAAQTGVPEGTIKRWRFESRTEQGEPNRTNRTPKNLQRITEAAMARAVDEASDYIADRLKNLADGLYCLAEEGLREVREFMRSRPEPDRDSAAWLRALVGAMHYGIQDGQLLAGKPTARPEVMEKHDYAITHRIVAENPGVLEDVFATDQQSGLADWRRAGARARLGELRRPDLSESEALLPPG